MLLNISGCVFMVIAIAYTFSCIGSLIYKENISNAKIFLMAIGIVGTIACFFIF